ncbi:ABC transporter substrate-binding protein [Hydrogenophaga sp.]|uniref:ABC transporter substrate-binding protein n=1 Tax=Hydrogenophaga sp. TaxID=1904254 RepID=UPI0035692276
MNQRISSPARKGLRMSLIALAVAAAGGASAAEDLKIGTVLSFSQVMGIYGNAILDGVKLAVDEAGGSVAGRKIVIVGEDDKNDPRVALQLVRRLVKDEKVDFLVGPVGSHIVQAIREDAHQSKTFLLVANAGNDEVTRELCSPYIIRTSFSNWQWNYPLGEYAGAKVGKRAAVVASNFVAGKQMAAAFQAGFAKNGGTVVEEIWPAMGTADFANVFTRLRGKEDELDTVWSFIPGSGTVNYVNQYAQAHLKPVNMGPQSNADDFFFGAMKDNALGVIGAGHYVVSMDTPRNKAFVEAFRKRYNRLPAAVDLQGYDSANLIIAATKKLNGVLTDKKAVRQAMLDADIDSPRGYFKIDPKTGNVIQNIYITKVVKRGEGYAHEILQTYEKVQDTDTSCKLVW